MASTGTMSHGGRPWLSRPTLVPALVAIGCGILFGLLGVSLSHMETRWLVYALGGVVLGAVTLAGDVRRNLMAYFVIGLSINLNYYLTQPEQMSTVGLSSPNCLRVPFVMLPAAALAVLVAFDVKTRRTTFRWGMPIVRFGILVVATVTLSTMLSSVRRYGLYLLSDMLQWFFIYVVTVNIVRTEDDLKFIIRCLLITLAFQCAVFLVQDIIGKTFTLTGEVVRADEQLNRGGGTVSVTPSGYAMFVEPLVFTALALWRIGDPGVSRRWVGVNAAVGAATLVLTLNRTSWITLLLGVCVVEFMCRKRRIARRLSSTTLLSIVGMVIGVAVFVIPLILFRIEDAHGKDWEIRRELMRIALRIIAANPVLGVGAGAYPYFVRGYSGSGVEWLWVVHNEYLLVWAERGLLGLMAWLAWMGSGLREANRASTMPSRPLQALGIGCLAGIIGLLWEYTLNMFPVYGCYALLWFLFAVLVAGNDVYARRKAGYSAARGFAVQLNGAA